MVPEMGRARARVKAIVFKIIGLVLRRSSAHLAASLAHTLLPVTSRRSPTFAAVEYAPVHPMTVHVRHVADGLKLKICVLTRQQWLQSHAYSRTRLNPPTVRLPEWFSLCYSH